MDMQPVYSTQTGPGERLCLGGDEIVVLATSAGTGGALFAGDVTMPPGGGPPVMHRHAPGEVYRVLDGTFTFYVQADGGRVRRVTARAGATVALAGGVPHSVRNESDADATAFVVHAPGGPMEGFVRAAAALAAQGRGAMPDVLEIAEQHGVELLGPIPAV